MGAAYRAAGARGRAAWDHFINLPAGQKVAEKWAAAPTASSFPWSRLNLSRRLAGPACNLGSHRMWISGGFQRRGRSTNPLEPLRGRRDTSISHQPEPFAPTADGLIK